MGAPRRSAPGAPTLGRGSARSVIGVAPRSRPPTSKAGGAKAPAAPTSSSGVGSTGMWRSPAQSVAAGSAATWLNGSPDWISPPAWPRRPSLDGLRAVCGLRGCWGGRRPTPRGPLTLSPPRPALSFASALMPRRAPSSVRTSGWWHEGGAPAHRTRGCLGGAQLAKPLACAPRATLRPAAWQGATAPPSRPGRARSWAVRMYHKNHPFS